jgi:IS30 family transposase
VTSVEPKERKLVASSRLHNAVNEGLEQKWSPERISARLDEEHPDDPEMKVSRETICQTLYLQTKGELRTELKLALQQGRARRVPRFRATLGRGKIPAMVNISERPVEADDRAVPGFWEGGLVIGKGGKSQIATLVERTSRFTMLARIPYDRCAERVAAAVLGHGACVWVHFPRVLRMQD